MFSLDVIDTDIFLEMPSSSQNLYFHLCMRADDDWFISSVNKIMRIIWANKNDLDVLLLKKFIIPFDSGVCVIRHWRLNNYIRSDRYVETIYKDEKKKIGIKDELYEFCTDMLPSGIPVGDVGKDSIGKYNIDYINNIYPTDLENDNIEENINNKEIENNTSKHSIELEEKEKNSAKKEKEIPPELTEFFNKQKINMPSINYQINKNSNYISWQIEFYNKLEKELAISWIKDYTKKDILTFITKDQFWSKNIWSISKLLKKNSDWVPYWIVMIEKMKQQWYKKVWWRVLPNVKDINPF